MTNTERIKRLAEWMGWEVKPYYLGLEGTRLWIFEGGRPFIHLDDWNPLTSISDAWILVEHILEHRDNYQGCIHIEHLNGDGDDWQVSCCFKLGKWEGWVSGKTAPEAICAAVEQLMEGE